MGDDIEVRLKSLEEDSRRNQETHKEFFVPFERLGMEYARIETQYADIMKTLDRLRDAIEELKAKPAKRWDGIVDKALWAVLAAVIAFFLGRLGL